MDCTAVLPDGPQEPPGGGEVNKEAAGRCLASCMTGAALHPPGGSLLGSDVPVPVSSFCRHLGFGKQLCEACSVAELGQSLHFQEPPGPEMFLSDAFCIQVTKNPPICEREDGDWILQALWKTQALWRSKRPGRSSRRAAS